MNNLMKQLKKSTLEVVRKIAIASNLTQEEVIRRMCRASSADAVTTHLNYGVSTPKEKCYA